MHIEFGQRKPLGKIIMNHWFSIRQWRQMIHYYAIQQEDSKASHFSHIVVDLSYVFI